MFQEKKGITCLLYNDMVYMLKKKEELKCCFLSFFPSPKVKEDRNLLSIKDCRFAFQTAAFGALTEKHRLVDDQNISCPPGKESVKVLRSC